MRITLLHNPGSGYGRYSKDQLLTLIGEQGYEPDYQEIGEGFEDVLDDPGELLVVAGGDGTVGHVAKAVARHGGRVSQVPIAPLPLGTANNTARYLGWRGAPEELIPAWAEARKSAVDIGEAEGPWGTELFLEAAGLGLFPDTMAHLSRLKGKREDRLDVPDDELAHDLDVLSEALEQQQATPFTLTLDGDDLTGEYLMVEAMNIDAIGPRLRLDPTAEAGDGAFEVVVLTEAERPRLTEYLAACAKANDRGDEQPDPPKLSTRRGCHLHIHWQGTPLHADSQVWQGHPSTDDKAEPAEAPSMVDLRVREDALCFLRREGT